MPIHRKLSGAEIHAPFRWVVADETERNAVSTNPDGTAISDTDGLHCQLYQEDTGGVYVCTSSSPVTFTLVSGGSSSGGGLTQDTTVNIPAGSSLATIQAIFDAQPKNLNGYTLTMRFADGTYDFGTDGCLYPRAFYGGRLFVEGNPADGKVAHSTQAVRLKNTRTGDGGILYFDYCEAEVAVRYIAFTTQYAGWNHCLLFVYGNMSLAEGCYFECNNGTNGSGVWSAQAQVRVQNCMFKTVDKCVGTDGGDVVLRNCTGDTNNYIAGAYGGYISLNTSLPSYTNALSTSGMGGQVWQS